MNRFIGITFLAAILFMFAGPSGVSAESRAGAITVSPFFGGVLFDHELDADNDVITGAALGYNLTKNLAAEFSYGYLFSEEDSTGTDADFELSLYRLEGLYHFNPDGKLVPFIAVGGSAMSMNSDAYHRNIDWGANYGIGAKYFLNPDVALRADVRHVIGFNEDVDHDFHDNLLYTIGVALNFGGKAKAAAAKPAPMDSDKDGVPDTEDKCPDTPTGIAVDRSGCPADIDKDGVPDHLDKCPDTPEGAKVDASGCPVDTDKDGVPDYLDKCPDTPAGVAVDRSGCPVPKAEITKEGTYSFGNVYFDTGKSVIKPECCKVLAGAVEYMRDNPGVRLEVQGHTDDRGDKAFNMKLSGDRAKAVREYMIGKGIAADRLTTKGFGEDKPAESNDTAAGRAKNRRIEFKPIR